MKLTLYIIVVLTIFSCNPQTETKHTVNIQNPQFYASYCIYLLNANDSIPTTRIQELASGLLPIFTLVDSLSDDTGKNEYAIFHFSNPKVDYPASDFEYLQHSGHQLSEEEKMGLQNPSKAVSITISGTKEDIISTHIRLNALIDSLMSLPSALVTDYVTYETFNQASWHSDRVAKFNENSLDITSQFTTHLYRDDAFCRAVTLGLGKFCLPDISIDDISCNYQYSFANLINLVAQTWIETPKITKDSKVFLDVHTITNDSLKQKLMDSMLENAQEKGLVSLLSVQPQEGDAFNTQMQIMFTDDTFTSPQEEQTQLITTLFGSADAIEYIKHDDEILAASQKAKAQLPRFKKLLNEGLEPGYSLLLKAPFKTDNGGNEWMWIEVTKWKDSNITGILQNDPFEISRLKAGAIVSAHQKDIFDYMYYHSDGTHEGNETGEIIGRGQ